MQSGAPSLPSKRLKIFKNGDESFGGKLVITNEKLVKSWDRFLAEVTRQLNNRTAIRSLHTPINGTEVNSFQELTDKMDYVAISTGAFKRLKYSDLKEKQPLKFSVSQKTPQVLEVYRRKLDVPGKIRDAKTGALTFFVYTNGCPMVSHMRISIPMKYANTWDSVINEIDKRMKSRGRDARSLFTLDGKELQSVDQIEDGGYYVAVGSGTKGFIRANYGEVARPVFYVPLNSRVRRHSNLPPVEKKKWNMSLSNSSHQRGAKSSEYTKKSLFSTFGSNENFYATSHGGRRGETKQINYDDDNGGVFRLKKQRLETMDAQEVHEDQSTKEEIPIEKRAIEHILENIENDEEFCDNKNFQNGKQNHTADQTTYQIKNEKHEHYNARMKHRDRERVELTYRKYS